RQRVARMVGEHVDRRVVGRVLAPPAPPRLVPRPVATAEHLAAHDVGAGASADLVDDLRVGVALTALFAVLTAPAVGHEDPLVQAHPALADGVLEALVGPGDEAVEGHRDVAGDCAHARYDPGGPWESSLGAGGDEFPGVGRSQR